MTLSLLLGTALTLPSAQAATGPDLVTTLTPPSPVEVDQAGVWTVQVANVGNRDAANVNLTVQLPRTATSPTVHIMGTSSALASGCSQVGTTVSCTLGTVRKARSTSKSFSLALPWSADAIELSAAVTTTTSEPVTSNNSDSETAIVLYEEVEILAPATATANHCTGTGLSAYYECRLYPSSISSHSQVFEVDGSLSFPLYGADYGGEWEVAGTELYFSITEYGVVIAEFLGDGVGGGCYEGLTTFPGSSYVSPYEVCF